MATFLFWNTNKKDLTAEISAMCDEHDVDVVVIAEPRKAVGEILSRLNDKRQRKYSMMKYVGKETPLILYRYPHGSMESIREEKRFSIYRFTLPSNRMEILIVAVHLPSKIHKTEFEQYENSTEIIPKIVHEESKYGHSRTIIIGDFNMNPFEKGMVSTKSFNAVMDKKIAQKTRRRKRVKYGYFYNPMWGRLGDCSVGPSGTHYYSKGGLDYYWHTLDQVLLRPDLLDYFDDDLLKVITEIDGQSLLKARNPGINDKDFSDHLPFVVSFDLERMVADEYRTEKSLG